MKRIASLMLLASLTASAQVSTNCTTIGGDINANTNCTSIGNTTNCTTNGTYTPPRPPTPITETGSYQLGQAAGSLIAGLIARHQFNSLRDQQCRQSGAGSTWTIYGGGDTYQGTCTDKQARAKSVATKHQAFTYPEFTYQAFTYQAFPDQTFTYPECAQQNNATIAKKCNALMAPDAPIVPACKSLATNNRGTQPEAYRLCAAATTKVNNNQ